MAIQQKCNSCMWLAPSGTVRPVPLLICDALLNGSARSNQIFDRIIVRIAAETLMLDLIELSLGGRIGMLAIRLST
jgi:hypothetical protein